MTFMLKNDEFLLKDVEFLLKNDDLWIKTQGDAVKPLGPWSDTTLVNREKWFVKPEERQMTVAEFTGLLRRQTADQIPYLSHQNDSLVDEFAPLRDDLPAEVAICIKIDEFCIENDGFCIENDEFCIEN